MFYLYHIGIYYTDFHLIVAYGNMWKDPGELNCIVHGKFQYSSFHEENTTNQK